jgi:ParB family chromosome partitioning protein
MTESTPRPRKRFTVDALFSDTRPQAVGVRDFTEAKIIDVSRIQPDPSQPRRSFDPDKLEELAESIKVEGVLQPIVVRLDVENDRYVIVHGERRWRASRMAGLASLPAIVRDVPVERRLVQQLMENVIRDDLNAVDRAAALRALRSQLGDPAWDMVADAVGIKRSRLFQLLGTGKLSSEAQRDIQEGRLSEKQSRALHGLSDVKQSALREMIVRDALSAPVAMRLSRAYRDIELVPADDPEAASRALATIREHPVADERDQVTQQTSEILEAIRRAMSGTDADLARLRQLAASIDTPGTTRGHLEQEINTIAKSLAALTSSSAALSPQALAGLRDLHSALGAILSET